jgi:hypothetical protein
MTLLSWVDFQEIEEKESKGFSIFKQMENLRTARVDSSARTVFLELEIKIDCDH